jgi:hypothetical protein
LTVNEYEQSRTDSDEAQAIAMAKEGEIYTPARRSHP